MKRSILSALLCLFCLTAAVNGQAPDNSSVAKDYVDPKLPKVDKKIWANLLLYYKHVRDIATSTLNELQSVQDFCWSSYRYLYAVERAANRAEMIWNNVKNFKAENLGDAIVYTEEAVFQNADALFYYDIPKIKEERAKLALSRDAIRERTGNYLAQLDNLLPDGLQFKTKYLRLMEINAPDARTMKNTDDKEVNFHVTTLSQASRQLAAAEVNNDFSDNQSAMLESTIKNADNDSTSDPLHQTEYAKIGEKNSMILTLQENARIADAVKTSAFFLLAKAKAYANQLESKEALLCQLESFSDALVLAKQGMK